MECLAETQISCGDLIAATITKEGHFTIHPANPGEEIIIGTAARNIVRGTTIDYSPNQNTTDILIKTDGPADSGVEMEDELILIKDGKAHPLGLKSAFEYEWEVNPGDESNV